MASLVSLKKERDDRTRQVLVDTDKSLADKVMPSPEAIDLSVEHIIKIQCAVRVFQAKKKLKDVCFNNFIEKKKKDRKKVNYKLWKGLL
jgi:hypothetical protein